MRSLIVLGSSAISAELGARVRQLRLNGNLTQQQMALMTGASLSSIRRLEASGQGTIELLVRTAQALQVVTQLEPLFTPPAPSISELERGGESPPRQRARLPRKLSG